jgi:mycothiol synthase
MTSSATEVQIRTPDEADAASIAAICNAISLELHGTPDEDEAMVRSWFRMSDVAMFLAERDGRAVGYADVRRAADGTRFPIDVRVAPDARDPVVGGLLLDAVEEAARSWARPGALARAHAADRDAYAGNLFASAGYLVVRHSFHMRIDLPDFVDAPEWPDGLDLRQYDPERDERRVYECTQEAFADGWDFQPLSIEVWREQMIRVEAQFDPSLWWLVEDGGRLAAVCLNDWHYSGDPEYGWISTLAVRRPWRRRGLGLALLRHSFADFAARGARRVGLGVDGENTTGAVRLYERAGMRPARRVDTYEKAL